MASLGLNQFTHGTLYWYLMHSCKSRVLSGHPVYSYLINDGSAAFWNKNNSCSCPLCYIDTEITYGSWSDRWRCRNLELLVGDNEVLRNCYHKSQGKIDCLPRNSGEVISLSTFSTVVRCSGLGFFFFISLYLTRGCNFVIRAYIIHSYTLAKTLQITIGIEIRNVLIAKDLQTVYNIPDRVISLNSFFGKSSLLIWFIKLLVYLAL